MKNLKKLLIITVLSFLTFTNINAENTINIDVDSKYVSVVEVKNDKVKSLYNKNSSDKMYPASMTKLMTVYVALLHLDDFDQKVTINYKDLEGLYEQGASTAGFFEGQVVSVNDLLHASLLPSGADATMALARIISGSEEGYVELMNKTAKELGMNNSNFVNASGLHNDDHYSNTDDLIILMTKALKNEKLKEMMSTQKYYIKPDNINHNGINLENTLITYSANSNANVGLITGGKTGWTPQAGYCLISFTDYNDKTIITASGGGDKYGVQLIDHNLIYNELINNQHSLNVFKEAENLASILVNYSSDLKEFSIISPEDINVNVANVINKEDLEINLDYPEEINAPVEANKVMASLDISYNGENLYQHKFVNEKTISRNILIYIPAVIYAWLTSSIYISVAMFILLAISLLFIIRWFNIHKYKKKRYRNQ